MTESILAALLTGGTTLVGVLVSNNAKTAVLHQKIEDLTREVRRHNGFAERIPVIDEQIRGINRRLTDLEREEY